MNAQYELDVSELRCVCDPAMFDFTDTSQVDPLDDVIGQKRAVRSIEFGLNMKSPGYNIFVTGIEGTGKSTIVRELVQEHAKTLSTSNDWCMVNNFKDEFRPRAVAAPSGRAMNFAKRMSKLIEDLRKRFPQAFEDKAFLDRQTAVQNQYNDRKQAVFQDVEKEAQAKNFQISRTPAGLQTVPIVEGKALSKEEYLQLAEETRSQIESEARTIQSDLNAAVREANKINQEMLHKIEEIVEGVALFVVKDRIDLIREEYRGWRDVLEYLDDVQGDIVENVNKFLKTQDAAPAAQDFMGQSPEAFFKRYHVNILVTHQDGQGAPAIFEANPTYQNVFGQIEKRALFGTLMTDFSMVQAGSLLQANGGFLIMEIESVLPNPFVWEALKRALQNKRLFIEDMGSGMGFATASMRPHPIPLDVKVILLGGYEMFHALQNYDPKFNKIFKVRADFDHEVQRSDQTIQQYVRFIARVCEGEHLLPFTPEGVAAIVEYGEKYVAHKDKLSLRFGPLVGILKEADYWGRRDDATVISDQYVIKAFNEHRFRYNLYEEKMHESYVDNTILIDVEKDVVGQVNALAVYQLGDLSFGRPSRITAETYMGREGVINIEREAKLSGKTHDKGMLILSGYMGRTFAQKYPLSLSASVTFEQSYGGIDGDSASSTELYAILSSLSRIPVRQGVAVTGSVNQKGDIQAIGGVNQKVEGFFEVCKAKGLTGRQGVMIPASNVKNLMLKKEVVDAVAKGDFHIYRVATVSEGIEILTGHAAGEPGEDGDYPRGTVFGEVQNTLTSYLKQSFKLKKAFESEDPDAVF